jgi:hypothetical protein
LPLAPGGGVVAAVGEVGDDGAAEAVVGRLAHRVHRVAEVPGHVEAVEAHPRVRKPLRRRVHVRTPHVHRHDLDRAGHHAVDLVPREAEAPRDRRGARLPEPVDHDRLEERGEARAGLCPRRRRLRDAVLGALDARHVGREKVWNWQVSRCRQRRRRAS